MDILEPACDCSGVPVEITDQTMLERKQRVLEKMKERKLDTLVFAEYPHWQGTFADVRQCSLSAAVFV